MSMKALRIDAKAQRRISVARDCLIGMSPDQIAFMTSVRLQSSFGLQAEEADQLLRSYCRRS